MILTIIKTICIAILVLGITNVILGNSRGLNRKQIIPALALYIGLIISIIK